MAPTKKTDRAAAGAPPSSSSASASASSASASAAASSPPSSPRPLSGSLARPFSSRARGSILKQTSTLMVRRKRLNLQLLREFERRFQRLPPKDRIPRREMLRLMRVQMRRERQYLATMGRFVEERERLARLDPGSEREADLDLVRSQLERFERSLGPRTVGNGEVKGLPSGTKICSENSIRAANNQAAEKETAEKKPAATAAAEKMTGAFDDCAQPKKRKRKDGEKERPKEAKKARKELPAKGKQTPSGQPSKAQPTPAPATSTTTKPDAAAKKMPQSQRADASSAGEKKQEYPTVKIHGRKYQVEKLPKQFDLESDDDEPKYKKMARAMAQPGYNDHVYKVVQPKKRRSSPDRFMSGALMDDPDNFFEGNRALMTPPTSDEADSSNGQATKKQRSATPKKRASPRSEPQAANNRYRQNGNNKRSRSVYSRP